MGGLCMQPLRPCDAWFQKKTRVRKSSGQRPTQQQGRQSHFDPTDLFRTVSGQSTVLADLQFRQGSAQSSRVIAPVKAGDFNHNPPTFANRTTDHLKSTASDRPIHKPRSPFPPSGKLLITVPNHSPPQEQILRTTTAFHLRLHYGSQGRFRPGCQVRQAAAGGKQRRQARAVLLVQAVQRGRLHDR